VFARIRAGATTVPEDCEWALLDDANFRDVVRFFVAFTMNGWVAAR
jgi:hypothetical protein